MDHDQYKLEDALTTMMSAIQELERRGMRAALKGGITADTRRQMLSHTDTIRNAIAKLPLEAK